MSVEYLLGIISTLIATLIAWLCKQWYENRQFQSKYSGKWETKIYDTNDTVVKSDILEIKHNKKTFIVKGTLKRKFPEIERGKCWFISGILQNNIFVWYTYTYEPIPSMASSCVRLEDDYCFKGYYLRFNESTKENEKIKIELRKIP